jgi:hypothetical protein
MYEEIVRFYLSTINVLCHIKIRHVYFTFEMCLLIRVAVIFVVQQIHNCTRLRDVRPTCFDNRLPLLLCRTSRQAELKP